MINTTLIECDMTKENQIAFLMNSKKQVDKLDFLIQSMIKTSRLEVGIIQLEPRQCSIYDTLANTLGSIFLMAESKHINIAVDCKEGMTAIHDRKWTEEAIFNILDNAVKYTKENGKIDITVTELSAYIKIEIKDNGIGIDEKNHGLIFKRFYRHPEVHSIDGIGIGLYLAREIITLQEGYIKLISKVGEGSTFSVFLPKG